MPRHSSNSILKKKQHKAERLEFPDVVGLSISVEGAQRPYFKKFWLHMHGFVLTAGCDQGTQAEVEYWMLFVVMGFIGCCSLARLVSPSFPSPPSPPS